MSSQAFFFFKNKTGDNIIVQGQDCRVDAATLHPKFVMTSMMRICLCGLASWRNNISGVFCLGWT